MMYQDLSTIDKKPTPFGTDTVKALWTDVHIAKEMLKCHLDPYMDAASYAHETIDKATHWIKTTFDLDSTKSVIDFGCGPGLYTTRLASSGAKVTGVDFSETSLAYAIKMADEKDQKIAYIHGDYLSVPIPGQYDLIVLIYCDFTALSPKKRQQLLARFKALLRPNGRIVLDVHTDYFYRQQTPIRTYDYCEQAGFFHHGPYYAFHRRFKYDEMCLLLDRHVIVTGEGDKQFDNWTQCFTQNSLEAELLAAGFSVKAWYGDITGAPYDQTSSTMAVVATHIV